MDLIHISFLLQLVLLIFCSVHSTYMLQNSETNIGFDYISRLISLKDTLKNNRVKKAVAIKDKKQLWNSGIIPFEIGNSFTGLQRRMIKLGMQIWEDSTCIKFVERDPKIPDFITIAKRDCGCCYLENIIRNEGRSELSLNNGCYEISIILHELGHVVGFYHEHEHPDRDSYVQINEQNVERGFRQEFGKYSEGEVDTLGLPYDYLSVMHYPENAFARYKSMETIVPLQLNNGRVPVIGNKFRLSANDIAATNRLYNCPKCGGSLTDTMGDIKLPNDTTTYCEWRIRAAHGEQIVFRIKSMDLQTTKDCSSEYLEIQNGYDKLQRRVIGRVCGQKRGLEFIISGSMIVSYFRKDNSNTRSELTATYAKICKREIFLLSNNATYIESPNYPKNYEANKDCIWRLRAPENHVIEIDFEFFSLELSTRCVNDYVTISDNWKPNRSKIGTYCGLKSPWKVTSQGRSAYLQFVSNALNEDAGFSASIIAIPKK